LFSFTGIFGNKQIPQHNVSAMKNAIMTATIPTCHSKNGTVKSKMKGETQIHSINDKNIVVS